MKSLLLASTMLVTLAASGAAMAADNTGNAPGGTGIEQSTDSMGATNKQGNTSTTGQMKSGANSSDDGGTGIKGSAEGRGATNKSTEDPSAPMGTKTGMSTGNTPSESGVGGGGAGGAGAGAGAGGAGGGGAGGGG